MNRTLNVALIFSLCGHLLSFWLINPVLSNSLTKDNLNLFFLGALFKENELIQNKILIKNDLSLRKSITLEPDYIYFSLKNLNFFSPQITNHLFKLNLFNLKPSILSYNKINEIQLYKKESFLMFYPYLPYSFLLYFKDREKAYLEFLFYISAQKKLKSIKRKISSGNLEVDLLTLRHITRSLYLIKDNFIFDSWQKVKIELNRKNDTY